MNSLSIGTRLPGALRFPAPNVGILANRAAAPALSNAVSTAQLKPSIKLIGELRKKRLVSLKLAKAALAAADNDVGKALAWINKKYADIAGAGERNTGEKSAADSKEGLVAIYIDQRGSKCSFIEANCATDFVSRNAGFQDFIRETCQSALKIEPSVPAPDGSNGVGKPDQTPPASSSSFHDLSRQLQLDSQGLVLEKSALLGERIQIKHAGSMGRAANKGSAHNIVCAYAHGNPSAHEASPGLYAGKIVSAVLLQHAGDASRDEIERLGKRIAQQVVGFSPKFVNRASRRALMPHSPDPASADALGDSAFLYQQEFMFGGGNVEQCLSQFSESHKTRVSVKGFIRLQVGESTQASEISD